jgi:hypothetical protein
MITPKLALFVVAAIIISVHSAEVNHIVNGGFENPNRKGGWSITTIPNWS